MMHDQGALQSQYDLAPLAEVIDVPALAAHVTEIMLDEAYSHVVDSEVLRAPLLRAATEKLGCLVDLIVGDITLDEIHAPASLDFAGEVGRQGISEQVFERSYRVGQEALWEWWMSVVEDHCQRTGDSVPDVLRPSIPLLFGFVDRMLFLSLAAYHDAVSSRHQSLEHRRVRIIDQLLDGTLADPGVDVERFIGYKLARVHVSGLVAHAERVENERLVHTLAAAAGSDETLVIHGGGGRCAFWIGLRGPASSAQRSAISVAAAQAGRRVAFGDVRDGLHGFRRGHRSAEDAAQIHEMLGDHAPPVVWAEDLRIEAFALRDPTGAREMVDAELGPALEGGVLTARTRETLEAWLVTGTNVGAAGLLGVHEQTVRQRLRRLEEALGRSLHDRRTELHIALRLSLLALPLDGRRRDADR